MPGYLSWDNKLTQLEDENARLRAELEALKPKPVVESCTAIVTQKYYATRLEFDVVITLGDNLKPTFHDGKLIKAKVIG